VTPRVVTTRPPGEWRSSYAEFRHARHRTSHTLVGLDDPVFTDSERNLVWWKYVSAPASVGADAKVFLSKQEHRTLSKASGAAGGFLAPTDFDNQVTTLRRRGQVIGALAREVQTTDGTTLQLGTATAHGVSTWAAENAAFPAPSDDTFGQVTVGAFKAVTNTIVSEELLRDAFPEFDVYLAGELHPRFQAIPILAVGCGLRPEELFALHRADVDRENRLFRVERRYTGGLLKPGGKTAGSVRSIPLRQRVLDALDAMPPRIDTLALIPAAAAATSTSSASATATGHPPYARPGSNIGGSTTAGTPSRPGRSRTACRSGSSRRSWVRPSSRSRTRMRAG
jgi:hypothetical protein